MKKNKLYTVNKFNKALFMPKDENLFKIGGDFFKHQGGGTYGGSSAGAIGNASSVIQSAGSSGSNGLFSKGTWGKEGAGNAAASAALGVANSIGQSETNKRGLFDVMDPVHQLAGGRESAVGNALGDTGVEVFKAGAQSGNPWFMLAGAGLKVVGGLTNALWGTKEDKEKRAAADRSIGINQNFVSDADNFDAIKGPATLTDTNIFTGGLFSGGKARRKNEDYALKMDNAFNWADRSIGNNVKNLKSDQLEDFLRGYHAYGGPLDMGSGALGLMQQNRYFDTIDKRSEAIAGKNNLNTAYTGGAKTFDFGGLKASFMDEFGTDPIAAAVRYSQGVERMQAEKEAAAAEAQREADYLATQQRLANLETQNQGLQALVAAQSMPTIETAEKTAESSSTPSHAVRKPSGNSTWDYVEDQLRKSGKFNDIQIEGIKYNLQRESSIDPTAVGDGGQAIGLGQWHGSRQPKDRSLEGQTQHLIDTLSNFDGKEHWIGRGNYEGFLNARTPEEAHYWIAKGYERPAQRIIDKVKRDSDMSLSRLKAFGGELGTNGTDWTNGLLYIDEGGTHEENPMEGVPMGVDAEGIPNLVEEGETVYNNYVFSDRMNVPDFMYKELGLGGAIKKKGKGMSFADASKKLAQESEQRPNDPISQSGLEASLSKLAEVQETERMRQQAEEYMGLEGYACGGKMGRKFDNGGFKNWWIRNITPKDAHGNRIDYGKVYTSISGKKDLTRSEDVYRALETMYNTDPSKFGTYDFDTYSMLTVGDGTTKGHRFEVTPQNQVGNTGTKATTGNAGTANGTRATADRSSNRNYGGVHADDIIAFDPEKAALEVAKTRKPVNTPVIDEATRQRIAMDGFTPEVRPDDAANIRWATDALNGNIGEGYDPYPTWMRYAPVAGAGAMALTDALGLTNKPDYTYADKLEAAANGAAYAPNIDYKPIGDYMRYEPLDRMFQQNQLNAIARSADRTIMNSSLPTASKYAALLAANYNNQLSAGNLFRQAQEYNRGMYERTKDFNRKTNMFNSQMDLESAMANARYHQAAQQMGLSGLAQAAALRDSIDARTGAAKAANLSNFFTSLGNIGRENFALNQINSDRSRQYGVYRNGVSEHKRSSKGKKGSRWFNV